MREWCRHGGYRASLDLRPLAGWVLADCLDLQACALALANDRAARAFDPEMNVRHTVSFGGGQYLTMSSSNSACAIFEAVRADL